MSFNGRSPASPPLSLSPSSSSTSSPPPDLKQRVVTCLNKLSDRDTLSLAVAELNSIARNLTDESFSPFLNCLHNTDSSSKSPVRKHCVAILSLMSRHHGDSLSPHVSKMVSAVIRRLRDPDSSVRSACAAAIADISARVASKPFSSVVKPLLETLVQDGDSNAQIGAALCLAAAVEAAADPEPEKLRKALPKLGKLLKSDGFKAKAVLLSAVGCIISVGSAGSKTVLDWLVPVLIEFLSNEDWAARNSAAEALGKIATVEELAPLYKKSCTVALETKRFDKVKNVRETMNQTLNLWKQVPNDSDQTSSSTDDGNSIGCISSVTRSSTIEVSFTKPTRPKKATPMIIKRSPSLPMNRSYPTTTTTTTRPTRKQVLATTVSCVDNKGGPQSLDEKANSCGPDVIKHTISEKSRDQEDKVSAFVGLRSCSRVSHCSDDDNNSFDHVAKICKDDVQEESKKDNEELSLIREQLALIENQQSSLLDLLQKFMGTSQNGIKSLESRVSGLEMALNEISCDMAVSTNSSCAGESCTEYLSPKFWRKPEERPAQTRVRNIDNEMAARENSYDQGMLEPTDAKDSQRGGSVYNQRRSSRNQFQDKVHTIVQKPTTRLNH
ncbi:unnamed protein product [Cochlearia groenlandica]